MKGPAFAIIAIARFEILPLLSHEVAGHGLSSFAIAAFALAEHLFELVDEALGERMVDVLAVELGEFLEQLALARGQAARRLDDHLDQLVAAPVAVKIDDALALEAQDLARLRAGRNLQLHFAFERRHFDLGAERGLRETDRHFDNHVVVLAHEHLVLLDVDDDVEVALRSAAVAGLALAAQLEARAVVDARRNLHRQRFGLRMRPCPWHFGHGSEMIMPSPRHCPQVVEIEKKPCWVRTWPVPRQLGHWRAPLEPPRARVPLHDSHCVRRWNLTTLLDAARGFFELDFEIVAQIVAAPGARARTSAAGAKKIAEDVGEDFFEALAEIEAAEAARPPCGP